MFSKNPSWVTEKYLIYLLPRLCIACCGLSLVKSRGFLQGPIFIVVQLPLGQHEDVGPGNEGERLPAVTRKCLRYMM